MDEKGGGVVKEKALFHYEVRNDARPSTDAANHSDHRRDLVWKELLMHGLSVRCQCCA